MSRAILIRQNYRRVEIWHAGEVWQGPDGRRVLLLGDRILGRVEIEAFIRRYFSEPALSRLLSKVRNWG